MDKASEYEVTTDYLAAILARCLQDAKAFAYIKRELTKAKTQIDQMVEDGTGAAVTMRQPPQPISIEFVNKMTLTSIIFWGTLSELIGMSASGEFQHREELIPRLLDNIANSIVPKADLHMFNVSTGDNTVQVHFRKHGSEERTIELNVPQGAMALISHLDDEGNYFVMRKTFNGGYALDHVTDTLETAAKITQDAWIFEESDTTADEFEFLNAIWNVCGEN